MYIKNSIFNFLNSEKDFIEELNENICEKYYKETSFLELKEKLIAPKSIEEFKFFLSKKTKYLIDFTLDKSKLLDKPIILLRLKKETIHRLNKVFFYYNDNSKLHQILLKNRYYEKEETCMPVMCDEQLYTAFCLLKNEDTVSYLEIYNEELEEYLNSILIKMIKEFLKENPSTIELAGAKLVLSDACNLQCSYCYQQSKRETKPITFELAKKSLRQLPNNARVILFGGEPFLHIDLMKQIILWSNEYKNFKLSIQTNGQTIDRDFFRDYCKNIEMLVSVDGPEHVHDLNRGKGSWKKAMNFYNAYSEETNNDCFIAATLYKNTIKYFIDILKMHYNTTKKGCFTLTIANAYEFEEEDFVELEKQMELIKNWYIEEKIYNTGWSFGPFKDRSESAHFSCSSQTNHTIDNGKLTACNRQKWISKNIPIITDDYDRVDYLSFYTRDIERCKNCEGCRLACPTGWRVDSNELYVPDDKFCRAGKIIVNKSIEFRESIKK